MINKVRGICDKIFYKSKIDIGYYVACTLYLCMQIGLFVLFGVMFDNLKFVIIGTIVSTVINSYTYTHHCNVLEHCVVLTQVAFIVFGFLSKAMSIEVSLLISILAIRHIYLNSPIKITHEDKDECWHKYKTIKFLFLFLIISIVLMKLGFNDLAKSVLWSIIMTDILMMENSVERV